MNYNIKKVLEKEIKKYTIVTLNNPTTYLKSLHMGKYCFVDDIEQSTKFISKRTAEKMIDYFYSDTGLIDIELLVVPIKISYELINELEKEVIEMNVYLDNAATTPLSAETKEYLIELLDIFGNPSSAHSVGSKAKEVITLARKTVANFINANERDILFTSGGSASNTLAISHLVCDMPIKRYYSPLCHKSILKQMNSVDTVMPVFFDGKININNLKYLLSENSEFTKPFVILEYASSEIGTIQDVKDIINIAHEYNGIVYLDCTGSISTIPLDVKSLDVDMVGFSAHKLGGLKGCGVLYKKPSIELTPLIYGNQEQGLVGGTENVLGIGSLYKAIEQHSYIPISKAKREHILEFIRNNIKNSYLVGSDYDRLPYNIFICFKGVDGEALASLLDMDGIQVSTGCACNSNENPSHTLKAVGVDVEDQNSCIRISLSGKETQTDVDYICLNLKRRVDQLRLLGE